MWLAPTPHPAAPDQHSTFFVQWFHMAEASFMAPGVAALFHWSISSEKDPKVKEKALKSIDSILQVIISSDPKNHPKPHCSWNQHICLT